AFFRLCCKIIDTSDGEQGIKSELLAISRTGTVNSHLFQEIVKIIDKVISEEISGFSREFLGQLREYFNERETDDSMDW
ncbi:MAG: hypothetical protein ACFFD4_20035, partial [Candidatus Odinarchaeota archaeon]